jgi:predicted MPP superfamily phosphohydrolase
MNRRRFIGVAGAAAAGAVATEGLLLAPRRLDVTHHRLESATSGGSRTVPAAEPSAVRVAVLTDLHLREVSTLHERIAAEIAAADVDLVVLVGDSIDRADRLPVLADFLALLPPGPVRLATLGNWEYWSGVDLGGLRRAYAAGDTRLLVNEGAEVRPGVVVFGADDSLAGAPDLSRVPGDGGGVLLLAHCPDFRDRIPRRVAGRIRAMIAGHTHGGQIAIGRWAPFRPPGSGRYVSGWYRDGAVDLFVSRGLGTSVVPVRLGATPELAVVDWVPGSGERGPR